MFFLLILIHNLYAIEPTGYEKRPELRAGSEVVDAKILFHYGFKDLNGTNQEWSWEDDYAKLNDLALKFGVLFQKHPLVGIIPDYNKLIELYQGSVTGIYRHWKESADAQKLTRRQSIELLLRFFQDYPYGMPPVTIAQKNTGGLLVPPLSLEAGWADCDSKSLMMATVLSYDSFFRNKLAMILVPGHALLGIEMPASSYDETYEFQNRSFVVAEPTGLSRTPLGRKNSPYSRLLALIPLGGIDSPAVDVAPVSSGLQPLTEADCPDEGLLVEYVSPLEKAKIQVCRIQVGNDFVNHGPLLKYDPSGIPKKKENYFKGKLQ